MKPPEYKRLVAKRESLINLAGLLNDGLSLNQACVLTGLKISSASRWLQQAARSFPRASRPTSCQKCFQAIIEVHRKIKAAEPKFIHSWTCRTAK